MPTRLDVSIADSSGRPTLYQGCLEPAPRLCLTAPALKVNGPKKLYRRYLMLLPNCV